MTRPISNDAIRHASKMIAAGKTLKETALAVGHGPNRLSELLRACGVVIHRGGVPGNNARADLPESQICEEYVAGASELLLSRRYGCSRLPITKILVRNNVTRRSSSDANYLRMGRLSDAERQNLVAKARLQRFKNMAVAANDASVHNHAVGAGEREIADELERRGHSVARQQMVGGYCIDIAIGNIAVEVKLKAIMGFSAKGKRTEYIIKAGKKLIFVIANDTDYFIYRINEIVAYIDEACRNPPPVGEYWVIWCHRKSDASGNKVYDLSLVRHPPKVLHPIS